MFWKIFSDWDKWRNVRCPPCPPSLILIFPGSSGRDTNLHSTSIITLEILALSQQVSQSPPADCTLSGCGRGSDLSQPPVYSQQSVKTHSKSDKEFPLNSASVYPVFCSTCLFTAQTKYQPHMRPLSFMRRKIHYLLFRTTKCLTFSN